MGRQHAGAQQAGECEGDPVGGQSSMDGFRDEEADVPEDVMTHSRRGPVHVDAGFPFPRWDGWRRAVRPEKARIRGGGGTPPPGVNRTLGTSASGDP